MLEIKSYEGEDVRSLHERSFPFPNLSNPLYTERHVVKIDNKVIGFGCLLITSEAILLVDESLSKRDRAECLKVLIQQAVYKGQQLGLKEIHAFLIGPDASSFAEVLRKHYGFEDIVGIPLVLQL